MNWRWQRNRKGNGSGSWPCARRGLALGALAGAALLPQPVLACAACFGQSDGPMARGMNMGILSLLLVVLFVLSGIAAFGIFLARRAARFAQPGQGGQVAVPAMGPPQPDLAQAPSRASGRALGEPSN